jgi:hypothetical protein
VTDEAEGCVSNSQPLNDRSFREYEQCSHPLSIVGHVSIIPPGIRVDICSSRVVLIAC